jgi:hypothetical protein
MTGRRLLIQVLSWDYCDYSPSMWQKPQNTKTKRWSKKVRRFLEKQMTEEITILNNK